MFLVSALKYFVNMVKVEKKPSTTNSREVAYLFQYKQQKSCSTLKF